VATMPGDWHASHTISAGAPYDTARLFRSVIYAVGQDATLWHHRGGFYAWNGAAYSGIDELEIRASLYGFLDQCAELDQNGKPRRFRPNKSRVGNVLDGLIAAANLPSSIEAPAWLDPQAIEPADVIACRNGLLHVPDRTLITHSPALFIHNAVDFDFEADAIAPTLWLEFLDQLWADDTESIDALQEIFGLMLTGETRHRRPFCSWGRSAPARVRLRAS